LLYGPIFDYFDPKEGEVPDQFDSEFASVAGRARALLSEWTREQIIDAADGIDAMLAATEKSHRDMMFDSLLAEATALEAGMEAGSETESVDAWHANRYTTPAGSLEWCIGRVDPAEVIDSASYTWSQLFSVLALGLIGHGWEEWHHLKGLHERQFEQVAERNIGSYAVDAMEAIAKAELLLRIEELEAGFEERVRKAVSDRVRTRNAKAAKERHAPRNHLKYEFCRWFDEHKDTGLFHSRNQAASRFYRRLPDEKKRLFSPTNAERALLDALREHLREQPAS